MSLATELEPMLRIEGALRSGRSVIIKIEGALHQRRSISFRNYNRTRLVTEPALNA